MKKVLSILLILLATVVLNTMLAKDKETNVPAYTIEGNGTGAQGTYLVKVTVISKKKVVDDAAFRRCAVHGVLFKGFNNNGHAMRPLAGSVLNESQHADFYKDFFANNGSAENYASTVSGSQNYIKSGKEYKVSAIVSVSKEQLHKDLRSQGVIKSLTNGF